MTDGEDGATLVFVDDREPTRVGDQFRDHDDVDVVEVQRLTVGDVQIEGVVFERKTPADFARSLTGGEGRLWRQAEALSDHEGGSYLLLEGSLHDCCTVAYSDVHPAAMFGAVASIMASFGVPVVPAGSLEALVDLAVALAEKHTDGESMTERVNTPLNTNEPAEKRIYACVEGVGGQTAETLYQHFDSVAEAVQAEKDDFLAVDGIGVARADNLNAVFGGKQ